MKDYMQLLVEWEEIQPALARLKNREMELRSILAKGAFPNPAEGVNNCVLQDGTRLKLMHKVSRKVDVASYQSLRPVLGDELFNSIIVHKPDLALRAYKALSQDLQNIVNGCLTVKPSAPTLEVIHGD